jgi:hypothetical protein
MVGQDRATALLNCRWKVAELLGIWLEKLDNGRWHRLAGSRLAILGLEEADDTEMTAMYLVVDEPIHESSSVGQCQIAVDHILSECVVTGHYGNDALGAFS